MHEKRYTVTKQSLVTRFVEARSPEEAAEMAREWELGGESITVSEGWQTGKGEIVYAVS